MADGNGTANGLDDNPFIEPRHIDSLRESVRALTMAIHQLVPAVADLAGEMKKARMRERRAKPRTKPR